MKAKQREIVRWVEALFALAAQIEARFHAAQSQVCDGSDGLGRDSV
jgi:hypothetical protein